MEAMDGNIVMVRECLAQKKMLFEQYEIYTDQMATCDFDQLEHYITQRSLLAIEIDKIDAEIKSLCEMDIEGEAMREAVGNRGNHGDFSEELQAVYESAAQVFTVINRIYQKEPGVLLRMQGESERLREKIKEESNTPKLRKYLSGLASQTEAGTYLGKKYDKA